MTFVVGERTSKVCARLYGASFYASTRAKMLFRSVYIDNKVWTLLYGQYYKTSIFEFSNLIFVKFKILQQKQIIVMPLVSIFDLLHNNFHLCLSCHLNFRFLLHLFFSQFISLSPFANHDIFDSIQMHL